MSRLNVAHNSSQPLYKISSSNTKYIIFFVYIKGLLVFLVINGEITGIAERGNCPLQEIPISLIPHSSFFLGYVQLIPNTYGYTLLYQKMAGSTYAKIISQKNILFLFSLFKQKVPR
uniref:Putative ovule protein n=1 Tax=Solanum chacoense TaxID=4108 RepID=A0A0V0IJY9_SOLCH